MKKSRASKKSAPSFAGLKARIQGAPFGANSAELVSQIRKAAKSLSAQEILELERLIAGRKANGELT